MAVLLIAAAIYAVVFSLLAPISQVRAQEAQELDAELVAATKAEAGRIE